ncbi:MAG TPA: hypothetical protein VL346_10830, partial [Acidobacteriaceae bacterium]|nr:hypothetical protein [Acidobacteriaceae bacterium]
MKGWIAAACVACVAAMTPGARAYSGQADGILRAVENAQVRADGEKVVVERKDAHEAVGMVFAESVGLGVSREDGQWWVLPMSEAGARIEASHGLWVLPRDAGSNEKAWYLEFDGKANAVESEAGLTVRVAAGRVTALKFEARPHSDVFGHRFAITVNGAAGLDDALAGFYWGTMLPLIVEKTMAPQFEGGKFKYASGYVLSTLNTKAYAGTYPAVDHEFQTKGRMAFGSELDLDVVKRMIGLEFRLMKDDPEGLWRAPCSLQPDGRREYHIRRNSEDRRTNAAMFPVTGNIEVVEEVWRYYGMRKDAAWLRENIENLEHAAGWTLAHVDQYGRLWGDVYYEDQVMKDGRETQIQSFGARSFELLAKMERVTGRTTKAAEYDGIAKKMAAVLVKPLPVGYWDEGHSRFVDWVDRDSRVHDHVHLVANTLPVTLGYATKEQTAAVARLVKENDGEFERFPSFLSVDVAGYTKSEIGDGGPYDLSAAGRYWYWDAAYREAMGDGGLLLKQLQAVAEEGAKDNYLMGERYDMDHVYYVDGKNAHGAEKYFEYPNVFSSVLIEKWLGLSVPVDADLRVAPRITGYGDVEFKEPEY